MQIVDGLKTGFRNLPKVEKLNYWLIQHLWSSSRQHMMCVASSCLWAPPTHLKHTLEEMTRSLEGSPVRPGLGHQSTLGQSELGCGGVGYKDIWRPSGPRLESDLRGWRGSQYHQCLHYPETAETPQPCEAAKSCTRRNQRTRMWSNNGAGQQRGHLGLAAPSSPPAECMTITHHCSAFFTAFYGVSGTPVRACSHLWGERGTIGNSSFFSLLWQTPTKRRQIPHVDAGSYSNLEESVSYSLGRNVYTSGIQEIIFEGSGSQLLSLLAPSLGALSRLWIIRSMSSFRHTY